MHKHKDETYDKPFSIVDGDRSDVGLAPRLKGQDGKADSVLSHGSSNRRPWRRPNRKSPSSVASRSNVGTPQLIKQINNNKSSPNRGYNNFREYPIAKDFTAGSVCSESDIGPSPSEVAAAIAEDSKYRGHYEGGSSMLEYEQSVGRWKREMPNRHEYCQSSDGSSLVFAGGNRHRRRHTHGGDGEANGKFKCFGNLCGYEYSIVCGNNNLSPRKKNKGRKRGGSAPSLASTYF